MRVEGRGTTISSFEVLQVLLGWLRTFPTHPRLSCFLSVKHEYSWSSSVWCCQKCWLLRLVNGDGILRLKCVGEDREERGPETNQVTTSHVLKFSNLFLHSLVFIFKIMSANYVCGVERRQVKKQFCVKSLVIKIKVGSKTKNISLWKILLTPM